MYLNDKLFHSIVSYKDNVGKLTELKIILLKLERIFSQGKILCREEIEKLYNEHLFCKYNYNGKHSVSLSKHPIQLDINKSKKIHYLDENAFYDYAFNYISLVLNDKLLEEYKINEHGIRMHLETQIKGSIDLKYLEAISLPINKSIIPFFREDCNLEDCVSSYTDNQFTYLKLQKLISLMRRYNIDVPIIDIATGNEYRDNKKYKQLIKDYN